MGVQFQNLGKNLGNLNKIKISTPAPAVGGEIFLSPTLKGSQFTLSNNNQTVSAGALATVLSQNTASSGKWYWEVEFISGTPLYSNDYQPLVGVANSTAIDFETFLGKQPNTYSYYADNGKKLSNNVREAFGATYAPGDIIGVAFDLDDGKIFWSKNGVFQASGDPVAGTNPAYSGLSGTFRAGIGDGASSSSETLTIHSTFSTITYSPPSGYLIGLG